jgi:ectoine hydroxylase
MSAQADPYWSRVGTHWEMAPRQDPVVWSEGPTAGGPLSPAEVEHYRDQGFVVKRGLIGEGEVERLVTEIGLLAVAADRSLDEVVTEPDSVVVRSIFRIDQKSEILAHLLLDPRLRGVATQLLGDDVYLHQSRVNFKPAFSGQAFPWHSDFETWHIEDGMPRMRALSASILLTTNTEHNGPLLVVPGSHRLYVRCVGETPPEHFRQSLKKQAYGVPDPGALTELVRVGGIASVTGPPGTVVFFDCNLMHGSTGNITPLPRHNIFAVYNSVNNRLVAPFGGTPARPDFLAARA